MATRRARRSFLAIPLVGALVSAAAVILPQAPASAATPRQYGINVYVTDNCTWSAGEWASMAGNSMSGVKSLGANTVALPFPFYMDNINNSAVYTKNACPAVHPPRNTPSAARLGVVVQAAKARGLHVVLRPLLDEARLSKWRGAIAPRKPVAWFASYKKIMLPYLKMAKANHVEQFSISGELNSMAKNKNWPAFLKWARHFYPGKLLFATTWPVGTASHPKGTTFGVDTYPNLTKAKATATVAQLLAGWNGYLKKAKLPAGVVMYEVAINAVRGAYKTPSRVIKGPFDQSIQVKWFTAACQFMKSHKLGGIYFWGTRMETNAGNQLTQPNPYGAMQIQPQAQAAVRKCFKS